MTKPSVNEDAVIAFRDAAAFEAWLDEHVDLRAGVWLKIAVPLRLKFHLRVRSQ